MNSWVNLNWFFFFKKKNKTILEKTNKILFELQGGLLNQPSQIQIVSAPGWFYNYAFIVIQEVYSGRVSASSYKQTFEVIISYDVGLVLLR